MSEIEPKYEHFEQTPGDKETFKKHHERLREEREKAAEHAEKEKPSIEKIRESIEKAAKSKDSLKDGHQETAASEAPLSAAANFRRHVSKRTIKQVQKQLPARDRAFSKVIHQPAVEAFSNAAEGTIARPSGLLFAGICSVVGSLVILYICRHYGYEYNFLIGLICLAGGFILGLLLEGFYHLSYSFFKK